MQLRWLLIAAIVLLGSESFAQPRVDFELATEPGFPLTGARDWIQVFAGIQGTRVQVRGARSDEREAVRNLGSDERPNYHVVGILTRRNRLRLPGAPEIPPGNRGRVVRWIEQLRLEGTPEKRATRIAFGLDSEELVDFHERMATAISYETKNLRAGDIARKIVHELGVAFEVTAAARKAFGRDEPVADELTSLSKGTALAALLRPLGLATAPRKKAGKMTLLIADADEVDEWWPIGWPLQQAPFKTAPALFEQLPVSISNTPLDETLQAIQGRVKIPFLYDHNSLARQQIDLAAKHVSFPRRKTSYKRVLDKVLFQARLKGELRTDDAGKPFMWITTN